MHICPRGEVRAFVAEDRLAGGIEESDESDPPPIRRHSRHDRRLPSQCSRTQRRPTLIYGSSTLPVRTPASRIGHRVLGNERLRPNDSPREGIKSCGSHTQGARDTLKGWGHIFGCVGRSARPSCSAVLGPHIFFWRTDTHSRGPPRVSELARACESLICEDLRLGSANLGILARRYRRVVGFWL